jgi:hypothetical protein
MSLSNRLARLEQTAGKPNEPCRGGAITVIDEGQPVPADAATCRLCGRVHVLRIVEVIDRPAVDEQREAL